MAAAGTAKMKAKLKVNPDKEMKPATNNWIKDNPKLAKLFKKPLIYTEDIELNPKKWTEGKLTKALVVLVRPELQLLAVRVAALMKKAETAKSTSEQNKVIKAVESTVAAMQKDIDAKCAEALDELASGSGDAKAALAKGKKAMSEIGKLDVSGVLAKHIDLAMDDATYCYGYLSKGEDDEAKRAMASCHKEREASLSYLKGEGKQAQNVAKFLIALGQSLKGHDNGQLDHFGKIIRTTDVQPHLKKLVADMDTLIGTIEKFSAELKKGNLTASEALKWKNEFKKMGSMQKSADKAVKSMKNLKDDFKKIEKQIK